MSDGRSHTAEDTRMRELCHRLELLRNRANNLGRWDGRKALGPTAPVTEQWIRRPCKFHWAVLVLSVAVLVHVELVRDPPACALENNYILKEITRPVADCRMCHGIRAPLVLQNVTRAEFARYAYSGSPVLVRGAAGSWAAAGTFSFDFFKRLYQETPGALKSVGEECQFFPFQTDFGSLEEVLKMPAERAHGVTGKASAWYIGWSNCSPEVAEILRKHYSRPHFLPEDSESSVIDWIFMGYSGPGASMHLDYVHRPSWQAQVMGTKTWNLLPPPECEAICHSLSVTVQKGDIILVNTNQWYHETHIHEGEMSITIGSEYD